MASHLECDRVYEIYDSIPYITISTFADIVVFDFVRTARLLFLITKFSGTVSVTGPWGVPLKVDSRTRALGPCDAGLNCRINQGSLDGVTNESAPFQHARNVLPPAIRGWRSRKIVKIALINRNYIRKIINHFFSVHVQLEEKKEITRYFSTQKGSWF